MVSKKGTDVHLGREIRNAYAHEIAKALLADFGTKTGAMKAVMRWTGASSRSVKYWLAGTRGPDGRHLMMLAQNSDAVFKCILLLSSRDAYGFSLEMAAARAALVRAIAIVDALAPLPDHPSQR